MGVISIGAPTPILFVETTRRLRHLQIPTTSATAPSILRMWDSFGHIEHAKANSASASIFDYSDDPACYLRPGDTLTIEIEVDPSFWNEGFVVKWSAIIEEQQGDRLVKFILPVENRHVGRQLPINIKIISHQDWHRHQMFDDLWQVTYCVLPPM